MKRLRERLCDDFPQHKFVKIDYGYLLAVINYAPTIRRIVSWFIAARLETIKYKFPKQAIMVIAHSNGTWAVGRAIEKEYLGVGLSEQRFRLDNLILLGCVLKRNFDWARFSNIDVANFVSSNDRVVLFARPFYFMGWAGRYGFKKRASNLKQINVKWGHSGFLEQYDKIKDVIGRIK